MLASLQFQRTYDPVNITMYKTIIFITNFAVARNNSNCYCHRKTVHVNVYNYAVAGALWCNFWSEYKLQ